jgi:RNA polymerase sigma-70 factor (ECF subfamily)
VSIQPGTEDDVEILRRAADGDREAFERIVSRYEASVYRFVCTLTPDRSRAEDALQETFLAAWRGARSFRHESAVATWLFAIARHAVDRQFRRRAGEPSADNQVPLETLGIAAGWGRDNPEESLLRAEQRAIVTRALDGLSDTDRQVLVLRDLEGLDGEEAARVLGLTLTALKSRLHRAQLRFAAALGEERARGR